MSSNNHQHLLRLITEYRRMPCQSDIVVFPICQRISERGSRSVVGLPTRDPWSLPFGHKEIFARRMIGLRTFFLYSEDDILITWKNIEAFLRASAMLPEQELAGFL